MTEDKGLTQTPKWSLRRIHLNQGGYDKVGHYWGHGEALWCGMSDDSTCKYVRSHTRKGAIEEIKKDYPDAQFHREGYARLRGAK